MASIVYPFTLTANTPENVNQLNSNLNAITAQVNGNLDTTNIIDGGVGLNDLSTAAVQQGGFTNAANIGRGATIIATTEARSNAAYGTLTTPDQVANVVVPANALLHIWYFATWQESVTGAARAALFIGANQLKRAAQNAPAPNVQEADIGGTAAIDTVLASSQVGLASAGFSGGAYSGDVTTGQVIGFGDTTADAPTVQLGGPVAVFVAAGTYTVSVQFKASSGSVTAKNRRLYVKAEAFA